MYKIYKIQDGLDKIQDGLEKYRYYFILVIACLVFFTFSSQLTILFAKAVTWIEPCNQWCSAMLIVVTGVYLIIKTSYKIWLREQYVSERTFATAIFLIIVYSFFRFPKVFECFTETNLKFDFWPLDTVLKWTDVFYIPFFLLIALKIIPKNHPDVVTKIQLLPDNPICKSNEDLLGYDTLSAGLLMDLNATDVSQQSFSVGIVGSWGQGKSSFLNLFKHRAEKQGSIVMTYNPRSSKSTETIQKDFFNKFKEELSHYHTGIEHYISNYVKDIAVSDEGWIGKVAIAINKLSLAKEKERINSIIAQVGKRIFVIIEDFDRLTGKEILEVLKLIDTNGDFCNTIYLTAYDKTYVNEVLNNYLGNPTSASYYTDKYFNYEFPLPVPINAMSKNYLGRIISENVVLPDNSIINKENLLDTWERMGDTIIFYLPNIRHVKRFYNIFVSGLNKLANDVDVFDFMLLTLLRYKDVNAYNSLVRFSFLSRGIVGNESNKIIYLQEDYQNNEAFMSLKQDSQKIIEQLFSVLPNDNNRSSLTDVYRKLRSADSFNSYFYDFRIGKYNLEDLNDLFKLSENDAFGKLKEMCGAGYFTQIEDFLKTRDYMWIADTIELERTIKLIVQLDSLQRSPNLQLMLEHFTQTSAEEEFIKSGAIKDRSVYKSVVLKSFHESLDTCSMEICFVCQIMLDAINSQQLQVNELVFSIQELTDLAVSAQKTYYSRYPEGDINVILKLTNIREVKDRIAVVVKGAQENLVSLMKDYPDKFAKDVVSVSPPYDKYGKTIINLSFNENFKFRDYLPKDEFNLYDWIKLIKDSIIANVVRSITDKAMFNDVLTAHALKSEYTQGDFEGFYEAITNGSLFINVHEYVDLGLPSGTLWATCNVGASSSSDYGGYYAWGETTTKSSYDWKNLKYRASGDSYGNVKFSKYVAESKYGDVDNMTRLDMQDDAARANWGGSWRMPTQEEWIELRKNCTCTWTTQGGHNGYKVTSNKNNNSIFLPAAGFYGSSGSNYVVTDGYYWSSSLNTDRSYAAYECGFGSSDVDPFYWTNRCLGLSVRPVSSSFQN